MLFPCQYWHMSNFPLSIVKTSCVFEKLTELWDTMWGTWDLAPALTQYQPGFGASNNSGASTISNFRIRSLWAELSLDKRTSGPYSLKKGNYLYRYYCVMDPICWWPQKHAVQYTTSVEASRHTWILWSQCAVRKRNEAKGRKDRAMLYTVWSGQIH